MAAKRILVTLSTGKQGSNVVRALSERNKAGQQNYEILAVTRDAQSGKSRKLASLPGVVALESPYTAEEIFKKAAEGGEIYGVFSAQVMGGAEETALGNAVADAAAKYKVKHFVYSSVDRGAEDKTDIPHFESKRLIEEHITKNLPQLPLTILRPTAFMDNISNGDSFEGKVGNTMFVTALTKPVQLIACSDIGEFAAKAFDDPQKYVGQKISLAGDSLDPAGLQKVYREVKGKELPTTFSIFGRAVLFLSKEMNTMFRWFNATGYTADIEAVRKIHPGLKTWHDFVKSDLS